MLCSLTHISHSRAEAWIWSSGWGENYLHVWRHIGSASDRIAEVRARVEDSKSLFDSSNAIKSIAMNYKVEMVWNGMSESQQSQSEDQTLCSTRALTILFSTKWTLIAERTTIKSSDVHKSSNFFAYDCEYCLRILYSKYKIVYKNCINSMGIQLGIAIGNSNSIRTDRVNKLVAKAGTRPDWTII